MESPLDIYVESTIVLSNLIRKPVWQLDCVFVALTGFNSISSLTIGKNVNVDKTLSYSVVQAASIFVGCGTSLEQFRKTVILS